MEIPDQLVNQVNPVLEVSPVLLDHLVKLSIKMEIMLLLENLENKVLKDLKVLLVPQVHLEQEDLKVKTARNAHQDHQEKKDYLDKLD